MPESGARQVTSDLDGGFAGPRRVDRAPWRRHLDRRRAETSRAPSRWRIRRGPAPARRRQARARTPRIAHHPSRRRLPRSRTDLARLTGRLFPDETQPRFAFGVRWARRRQARWRAQPASMKSTLSRHPADAHLGDDLWLTVTPDPRTSSRVKPVEPSATQRRVPRATRRMNGLASGRGPRRSSAGRHHAGVALQYIAVCSDCGSATNPSGCVCGAHTRGVLAR